jgi:CBS domain-containing protein
MSTERRRRTVGASVTVSAMTTDPGAVSCDRAQITRDDAAPQLDPDHKQANPKTHSARATAADARAFFDNPKVVSAVVADGQRFVGLLERSDLPSLLAGSTPIRTFARREVATITPDRPVTEAVEILDARGLSRLVVLDDDGQTLVGLLCLDRKRAGFCTS